MLATLLVLLSDFVIFFEFLLVTDPKIWCSQPTLIFPHLSTLIEYLLSIQSKFSQLDDEWKEKAKMIVLFLLSPITYCPGEMQLNIRIINAYQFLKVCKTGGKNKS